jgi:hypothetical protein
MGYFLLEERMTAVTILKSIASGALFYLLFYYRVPRARVERKWLPTLGAAMGFAIGYAIGTLTIIQ